MSTPDGLPPLREVVAAHGLAARKSLGQNFLFDLNLTGRIARAAGPLDGVTVLEVGPGPGGLTRALLAPSLFRTSYINLVDCPVLPIMPEHKPQTWDEQPYHELSPYGRAHILSAVVALLADEPVSRLMSGAHLPFRERHILEKLLSYVPRWVQATLIRNSTAWPARLRVRIEAHQRRTGMDAESVLAQFHAWRAERDQRHRERLLLSG